MLMQNTTGTLGAYMRLDPSSSITQRVEKANFCVASVLSSVGNRTKEGLFFFFFFFFFLEIDHNQLLATKQVPQKRFLN